MDRLISLEPSNQIIIRLEPDHKSIGELTLRNVMHTMPVAFRLQPTNRARYSIRPQSGVIAPLSTLKLQITYLLSTTDPNLDHDSDSFELHSVVVPGAAAKSNATLDSVPNDWFTARKKQVFVYTGIRTYFVGSSLLTRLVTDGLVDALREALERSNPEWRSVDSVDTHGQTLLHLAIARSRADLVQVLLEFKPDVEKPNRAGRSPMEAAAAGGETLIVELLLANGASTERSVGSAWGPLHHAAAGGHLEVMKLLVMKGGEVDGETSDGRTALHLAVGERRRECVRLLLANGARTDVRGGEEGDTALHVAAECGDEWMVRVLVGKGCAGTREGRNKVGKTAYDVAVEGRYERLYDELRLGKKGEGRVDQNGWTALMRAGFKGRVEMVKRLVEMGVEMEEKDEEGYTALHCAVESGKRDVVEVLVKCGADVEARTRKGRTVMMMAEELGYVGIVKILVQGGGGRVMKRKGSGGGDGGRRVGSGVVAC